MKNIKYTDKILKQVCEEKDLLFVDVEKVKDKNKSRRIIKFICFKHIDKGIQSRPVEKIVSNKKPCQYCNHTKLKDIFIEEMKVINPDIKILSGYVNWNTKIHCRCKIHKNYEWDAAVSSLLYGSGCKLCGHIKRWDSRGRKTTRDFILEMENINSNIKIIGEYTGSHNLIKCKCKIDNREWESYPANLLNKTAGCPTCATRRIREAEGLTHKEFIQRLNISNENIDVLDEYQNVSTKLRFRCKTHNYIFETSPRTFLYKGGKGCPYCNQSVGEHKMVSILKNKGFAIKQQYTFDDCKYINKLRFDAYDIENNIVYEYQGQQHYYPIDFAGKGKEWANEQFEICVKRDDIKSKYCDSHNIPLIKIPYWEFDNMEDYINIGIQKYLR